MSDKERDELVREALLDGQFRSVRTFALDLKHPERYDTVRAALQNIMQPCGPSKKEEDRAEIRRLEMQSFFHNLGFTHIIVPKLILSNRKIRDGRKKGKELFYRPATKDLTYDQFMKAVGQGNHWTVADKAERAQIGWEDAKKGYWFWAEAEERCPRTGTPWSTLVEEINLLLLEEYVIPFWERKKTKNIIFDRSTYTWLRTRWNSSGALRASEYDGVVNVNGYDVEHLAISRDFLGGRLAEVIH